jgi:hypothetical protein
MVEDSRSTLRPAKFYILDFTFLFIQKALNCSDSVKGLDVKFTILETPEIQLRHFCAFRIGLHSLGWRASPADEGAKNLTCALQELFVGFRPPQRLQKTSRLATMTSPPLIRPRSSGSSIASNRANSIKATRN